MVEVKGTLDELYSIFGQEVKKETIRQTRKAGKKVVKGGVRKVSAYQKEVGRQMKRLKKLHPRTKMSALMKKAHTAAKRKMKKKR